LTFGYLYLGRSQKTKISVLPSSAGVLPVIAADAQAVVLNRDGVRSFASRLDAVDALKRMQALAGYQALLDAQQLLSARLSGALDPQESAYTRDLVARIERAVSPYFE
jgi:hypothetical protein